MPILLSEQDVRIVLTMDDLIEAMQAALEHFSAGHVEQPLRTIVEVQPGKAFLGVMPAFLPKLPALGSKLVSVFGTNAALGLPTHLATIAYLDHETGEMLALMDGRFITEARTGAVSAVSTRLLARDDAMTLGIVGSGVQARSHLEALGRVRILRDVKVWSPNESRLAAFIGEMGPRVNGSLSAAGSAEEAVAGAALVVLATSSREPVVRNEWIADGTHVCAVGSCRPDQREMDTALMRRARVFVDSRTGALAEAGDIVLPIKEGAFGPDHIAAELGEVVAGRVPGRRSRDEVTVFKSLGMAVEDVAAAHLTYQKAVARGLGRGVVL